MKREYDFSKGLRGKFYRPHAEFRLPGLIQMDRSGRLVLPKVIRERLNLRGGARLSADVVAARVELVPIPAEARPALKRKGGIVVVARTGAKVDAAAAVAAVRKAKESRGLIR